MKKILLTLFIFFFGFYSPFGGWGAFAQNPLVKIWDKRFGGTGEERIFCFQQTKDGGYILGGWSISDISGDKTEDCRGYEDFWIVKIDSVGIKQWDRDFGGTGNDELHSLQQTTDGGYILGGYSTSDISGDKTQATWGGTGDQDYWIVKIDSLGNKQWDKDFGGISADELFSLQQTSDGGYVLGGCSSSGISGDKTQASRGILDFWIVKIDSLGNRQWDKDFGGTGNEALLSLQQTTDGGFIMGGYSESGIGGDKTEAVWGSADYWIVKIDSFGIKQWDRDFGGDTTDLLKSLQETPDHGYILGGYSYSGFNGNKTQANWDSSGNTADYWILKIDSIGNKEWDKDFGGTAFDILYSLQRTSDGGYILGGTSNSGMNGDKTENNLGLDQTWVVKTDSLGNKQWDKTIFTFGSDLGGYSTQTKDGCYALTNYTSGGIGGYKTQGCQGGFDYWIIKFCDSTLTTNIAQAEKENEQLVLAPNPTQGKLAISSRQLAINAISIYNLLGEEVLAVQSVIKNPKSEISVDVRALPSGIYFVKATTREKILFGKVVKE